MRKPDFTPSERALIRRLNTPERVQRYLSGLTYNFEKDGRPTLRSFRRVARDGVAHCLEGVLSAAAILQQHGYPPLVLCMEARDIDHNLFIYRRRGRWGSIAQSRDPNLLGRDPVHRTLWELAMSYHPHYWNYFTGDKTDLTLRGYAQVNLNRFRQNWVTTEEDLWFVEDYLYEIPYRFLVPRNRRKLYLSTREEKVIPL